MLLIPRNVINRSSDQMNGLVSAVNFMDGTGETMKLINSPKSVEAGVDSRGYGELGGCFVLPGSTANQLQFSNPIPGNAYTGTLTCWFEKLTTGDSASQVQFLDYTPTGTGIVIGFNHEGYGGAPNYEIRFFLRLSDYNWVTLNSGLSGGVVPRKLYFSVGRYWWDGSTDYYATITLFANDTYQINNVNRTRTLSAETTGISHHGVGDSGGSNSFSVRVYESRYYNRVLEDHEVHALWNPATRWDLYKPLSPSYFFPASTAVFPFSDNFTGSDNDPWDNTKWTTSVT